MLEALLHENTTRIVMDCINELQPISIFTLLIEPPFYIIFSYLPTVLAFILMEGNLLSAALMNKRR